MAEFLVTANFLENYSFVLQDAAQRFHWNNSQATLNPFVAYYRDTEEVCHLRYVVISNSLHHDTVAVHLFQKSFIAFPKDLLPARLPRPYNDQLMTPRQLFDWACTNVPVVHFGYCSNEDYARELSSLERHFQLSRTIPGTRKMHSFVPVTNSTVEVRLYSASDASRKESL